jgi:enediyne biosynthesis protein E4
MNFIWPVSFQESVLFGRRTVQSCDPRDVFGLGPAEYADWIQVQWPAAIGRTNRFERVRAGKDYSLSPGDKLL